MLLKKLVDAGVVDAKKFDECLRLQEESGESLARLLANRGLVGEDLLFDFYNRELGLPVLRTLGDKQVPEAFVRRVPVQFARSNYLVAVGQDTGLDNGGTYTVATCEPLELHAMDELSMLLGAEVDPILAPKTEITALLNKAYHGTSDGVDEALEGMENDDYGVQDFEIDASEDVLDVANKAPIIKLVNMVLFEALKMRASDIHLQPYEDKVVVRYRIDGILYDMKTVPKRVQDAVTSRIKVMGKMDIAERRLPQDGRTTIRVGDGEVDLRISTVPTSQGERIVFRLLDKTSKVLGLEEIGLSEENLHLLADLIHSPNGIVFVTGPTGSGKTTTLYAALTKLNSAEKNIITIEDPIEYHLDGISQIQVSGKKGLTFAAGLRSLLRQDPDIMMVGEVRDVETARIAIQSALTGHLVFSTLHTNDSAGAVTRMVDIGIEPYLVASSVIAVVAQRLVRLICEDCKAEYEPTEEELKEIGLTPDQLPGGTLWVGMGCKHCLDTGYLSRTAIYELLVVNEAVRELITERAPASIIKQEALKYGLRTLRMDGALKVLLGQTTIEEVLRVTQMDVL